MPPVNSAFRQRPGLPRVPQDRVEVAQVGGDAGAVGAYQQLWHMAKDR